MHQYASLSPRVLSKQYTNINIIDSEQLLRLGTESNASGEAQDGCVMFTTSGTTSRPKLVLHTQSSIAIHAQDTIETLEYNALDTVIQVVTPLSGVSGHGMPIAAIAARAARRRNSPQAHSYCASCAWWMQGLLRCPPTSRS